ncbi:MAG TPA: hypothetical protein VK997_04120 [Deferrisomatales bacterium]|nr:hypothetical protein [Deferrisomatales bacterium]
MGEIKSSIELAMERTRHLAPTGEEQAGLSERERRDRALPLVRRLLHGDLDPAGLGGSLEALQQAQPQEDWATVVARECAGALVPGINDAVLLPALESLGFGLAEEIAAAVNGFKRDMQAASDAARAQLASDLRQEGISGSAVLPNPTAAPEWHRQQGELLAGFAATRDDLLKQGR